MIELLVSYVAIGVTISVIISTGLWYTQRDRLDAIEVLACILIWPTVITSFINKCTRGE